MASKLEIKKALGNLDEINAQVVQAAMRGVMRFANHVAGQAAILAPIGGGKYSPRDLMPGALRSSATVEEVRSNGGLISTTIGFNMVYAHAQHERLDYRHDNGQAKYLETSMRANEADLIPFVIAEIKKG